MYAAGESGMGYCLFTLRFVDGSEQSYCTGNLVDFVALPEGKNIADIVGLDPHQGRSDSAMRGLDYSWCLFGVPPQTDSCATS
jgi:hypothetical protein